MINEVRFVPLNKVYRKVNNVLQGCFADGKIDLAGDYKSPPVSNVEIIQMPKAELKPGGKMHRRSHVAHRLISK